MKKIMLVALLVFLNANSFAITVTGSGLGSSTNPEYIDQRDVITTRPWTEGQQDRVLFAQDANGNINMAIDAQFSGTPTSIHNGTDSTLWTATAITGVWNFASTAQAYEGTKSISAAQTVDGDIAQIATSNPVLVSENAYISGYVKLTKWDDATDGILLYAWDVTGSVMVGNSVDIADGIDPNDIGVWQRFFVSLSDLGLTTESIYAFRIEMVGNVAEPQSPDCYFDNIQFEETTGATTYTLQPRPDTVFIAHGFALTIANPNLVTTENGGTMTSLDYSKWFGLDLTNGWRYNLAQDGVIEIPAVFKTILDILPFTDLDLKSPISKGAKTACKLYIPIPIRVEWRSDQDDYVQIVIRDDMSSLDLFTLSLVGSEMPLTRYLEYYNKR